MKLFAVFICLVFCYSAFAFKRPGFEDIPDSELPSLQTIVSAGIQGALSLARNNPELALGSSIFHVDRIPIKQRNIRKDGITYLFVAGVSDTANSAVKAVVACELEQDAKTGSFTLRKYNVKRA